jgi:hypothetical protein
MALLSSIITPSNVLTATNTQTVTNKTIDYSANVLTGVASTGTSQTLTNKTIAFADNVLTGVASTGTSQTLTNKTITTPVIDGAPYFSGSVRQNIVSVSALDVDCSTGNYFVKTINGNSTFTFSNAPADRAFAFSLELTHTSGTVTWPASVKWSKDTAPTLTTGKTHIFTFVTDDAGTRWRGTALVDYVN